MSLTFETELMQQVDGLNPANAYALLRQLAATAEALADNLSLAILETYDDGDTIATDFGTVRVVAEGTRFDGATALRVISAGRGRVAEYVRAHAATVTYRVGDVRAAIGTLAQEDGRTARAGADLLAMCEKPVPRRVTFTATPATSTH